MGDGNKVSIINEFSRISMAGFPNLFPMIFVVSRWQLVPGNQFRHRVAITDSNRRTLRDSGTRIVEGNRNGDATSAVCFNLTEFKAPGDYCIEEFADEVPVHVLPLKVSKLN
jgi:hypothetical protein